MSTAAAPAPAADERTGSELHVEGVSIRFGGVAALQDVSLRARRSQVLGVIGPNGAGKTTLFNVICGFVRPDSGTIRWRGSTLGRVKPHQLTRLGIARTIQGVRLFGHLTARENVMVAAAHRHHRGLAAAVLGLPRADRAERRLRAEADAALERLGVADVADHRADGLPYPIQKRVALARALATDPELLLLDEPAGGLGAGDVRDLGALIAELKATTTVMLVEHRMDLVMSVCDHLVVLDAGQVIAEGPPAQVGADPQVLEAYLGRPEEEQDDARG